jgi:hypothetical protein
VISKTNTNKNPKTKKLTFIVVILRNGFRIPWKGCVDYLRKKSPDHNPSKLF